jgi:hypothetical protein
MIHIFFIYADNCNHCQKALANIEIAISKCKKISCEIHKFKYDSQEAITIAIKNGIDDLPGIVIGNRVFVKDCSEKNAIDAIKKAAIN